MLLKDLSLPQAIRLKKFSKTKLFLTLLCMLRAVCTVKAVSPDLAWGYFKLQFYYCCCCIIVIYFSFFSQLLFQLLCGRRNSRGWCFMQIKYSYITLTCCGWHAPQTQSTASNYWLWLRRPENLKLPHGVQRYCFMVGPYQYQQPKKMLKTLILRLKKIQTN